MKYRFHYFIFESGGTLACLFILMSFAGRFLAFRTSQKLRSYHLFVVRRLSQLKIEMVILKILFCVFQFAERSLEKTLLNFELHS